MESQQPQHATEAAEAHDVNHVDALPDEVLVMIFNQITCGRLLLHTLSLVCKRWRRLAQKASSWSGVEHEVSYFVAEDALVLLHAPALASLEINVKFTNKFYGPDVKYDGEACRRLLSALRRTRAVVRRSVRVTPHASWLVRRDQGNAFARFLARQKNLPELELHLSSDDAATTLATVATLRRLKKLGLTTGEKVSYNQELAGALPELRELRVHGKCPRHYPDFADMAVPRGLVGDLVRGAPALRVLEVDMPQDDDRLACAAQRGLEHVELNIYRNCQSWDFPIGEREPSRHAVRQAGELLLKMAGPTFRSAVVVTMFGKRTRNYSCDHWMKCKAALSEFTAKMPDAKVELVMQCGQSCNAY